MSIQSQIVLNFSTPLFLQTLNFLDAVEPPVDLEFEGLLPEVPLERKKQGLLYCCSKASKIP